MFILLLSCRFRFVRSAVFSNALLFISWCKKRIKLFILVLPVFISYCNFPVMLHIILLSVNCASCDVTFSSLLKKRVSKESFLVANLLHCVSQCAVEMYFVQCVTRLAERLAHTVS